MMHRLKAAVLATGLWMLPALALAQTGAPSNWTFGYVPTVAEWNAVLASKADYNGSSPITAAGGTFTGKVNFAASTTGTAGLNCGSGTAPSSPINGDVWCTSAGMFIYAGGTTIGPFGAGAGGTLAVGAGGTGVTTITSGNVMIGQGTSPITSYPTSGTNTRIASTTITSAGSGHCVSINGAGDLVDAGVGACGGTGGSGTVSSSTIGQVAVYSGTTTVTGIAACNNGYYGTNGSGTVSCLTTVNATLSGTITALGTIASGAWQSTTPVGALYGGTGVAQGSSSSTITLGGAFTTSGAAITLTAIGATNVTLPTSGTLMNQNGTSGGIPYYNTTTTTQSSAALTANLPVIGGGAGAAPSSGSRQGNTTAYVTYAGSAPTTAHCAQWDSNGNISDSGGSCAGASGGAVLLCTITPSNSTTVSDVSAGCPSPCSASGCFTNAYRNYTVVFSDVTYNGTPTSSVSCQIQVYIGGSYQTAANYSYSAGGAVGGSPNANGSSAAAFMPCTINSTFTQPQSPGISGSWTVENPSATGAPIMWHGQFGYGVASGPTMVSMVTSAMWQNNGAVTGFRVFFATSGSTPATNGIASGIIKVYGNP